MGKTSKRVILLWSFRRKFYMKMYSTKYSALISQYLSHKYHSPTARKQHQTLEPVPTTLYGPLSVFISAMYHDFCAPTASALLLYCTGTLYGLSQQLTTPVSAPKLFLGICACKRQYGQHSTAVRPPSTAAVQSVSMSDFSWEACSLSTFKSAPLSVLYKLHLTQQSFWKCVPLFSSGKNAPFFSSISAPLLQNTSLDICAHKEIALSSCKSCLFLFSPKLSFG